MSQPKIKIKFVHLVFLALITPLILTNIIGTGCENMAEVPDFIEPECGTEGGVLQLHCPAPPNTNLSKQPDYDNFAWNTFIALNWPALIDQSASQLQRGIPDLSKSFVNARHDDVTVWETFKEKREIFNVNQETTTELPPWNNLPVYGPIPARPGPIMSIYPGRIAGENSPPEGYVIWNTLDETEEVNGEELEGTEAFGQVVNPRVWKGPPENGNPVLYEVKVNWDFYNYVNENKLFIQQNAIDSATSNYPKANNPGIRLPYRTSASSGPGTANRNRDTLYSVLNTLTAYEDAQTTVQQHPPALGNIHLKAAWIRLFEGTDDFDDYHTTTAEYYVYLNDTDTIATKQYATFGLVGLHIIQRVHTNTGDKPNQTGGTFIFASWEHYSDTTGFTYSNYVQPQEFLPKNSGWFPHKASPTRPGGDGTTVFLNPDTYPVKRMFPILENTRIVNDTVHARIKRINPNSVWLNYQLIGTQFRAVPSLSESMANSPSYNDPMGIGQPQYMANLVIETSKGLQHFQGRPPLFYPVKHFSSKGVTANDSPAFARDSINTNILAGGTAFNMGGCMGCHGVAQTQGYSFSFVLLAGNLGAGVDAQVKFDFTPPTVPHQSGATAIFKKPSNTMKRIK